MTRHIPTRNRERKSFFLAQLTMKNLDFHLFEITCELKYSCANIVVNESLSSLSLAIKDNDPNLLIIICSYLNDQKKCFYHIDNFANVKIRLSIPLNLYLDFTLLNVICENGLIYT